MARPNILYVDVQEQAEQQREQVLQDAEKQAKTLIDAAMAAADKAQQEVFRLQLLAVL